MRKERERSESRNSKNIHNNIITSSARCLLLIIITIVDDGDDDAGDVHDHDAVISFILFMHFVCK